MRKKDPYYLHITTGSPQCCGDMEEDGYNKAMPFIHKTVLHTIPSHTIHYTTHTHPNKRELNLLYIYSVYYRGFTIDPSDRIVVGSRSTFFFKYEKKKESVKQPNIFKVCATGTKVVLCFSLFAQIAFVYLLFVVVLVKSVHLPPNWKANNIPIPIQLNWVHMFGTKLLSCSHCFSSGFKDFLSCLYGYLERYTG